jgi:hypothetical protein
MDNSRATNIRLPAPKSMNKKIYDNVQDTNFHISIVFKLYLE